MQALILAERDVLLWIQEHLRCAALDPVMKFLSTIGNSGAFWIALTVALLIACADQTATLAKEYLPKQRPTHFAAIMADVHTVNGYVGGPYGTVSSHAANCFGLALLSSLLIRRRWFAWMMFGWATLVSYSRIYLGVHYPMDILFGTLEGLFWAFVWYRALCWADMRITALRRLDRHTPYRLCFMRRWREKRMLWPLVSFLPGNRA